MKRFLKILVGFLLLVSILAFIGYLVINSRGIPKYETQTIALTASQTPEAMARGEKLVSMLCANCHRNNSTGTLAGGPMVDAPPEFGEIYAPNITGDKMHGIGEWTDGEIAYLIRTGIKKDGQYSPPYMAKLPLLADKDLDAIISFLRSDHPMVAADATPDIPSKPSFLTKLLSHVAFKPYPMPEGEIPLPDASDELALGKYLTINLECFSCHSADFKTNNYLDPESSPGYMAGGNQMLDKQGRVMITSNLTPHLETGIGGWTKQAFIQAVRYGQKEGENALVYPMIPYVRLTVEEAGAIYAYLQTIPAIENKVERTVYD